MFLRDNEVGSRIAPHLRPGDEVLDYGSGTGRLSRWLAERVGVAPTGADLIEYRNRRTDVPFIRMTDPFRIPAPDRSFDVVLVLFALHHNAFEAQGKILAEAARLARRRVIVLEDTPMSWLDRLCNVFWDKLLNLRHGVPTPFTFRSVREWTDLFLEHDLEPVQVESYRPKWPTLMMYHHTLFVLERSG